MWSSYSYSMWSSFTFPSQKWHQKQPSKATHTPKLSLLKIHLFYFLIKLRVPDPFGESQAKLSAAGSRSRDCREQITMLRGRIGCWDSPPPWCRGTAGGRVGVRGLCLWYAGALLLSECNQPVSRLNQSLQSRTPSFCCCCCCYCCWFMWICVERV